MGSGSSPFVLLDDQKVSATLIGVDDAVPPNTVPLPTGATGTWTSSDTTILTVDSSTDPTGLTATVTAVGKLGTAQLQVSVVLTPGATPITGSTTIQVNASALASVSVSLGTPVHQ